MSNFAHSQKEGCIYTLSDPDGLVRYVGQTVDVEKRYGLHLFHSKNGRARTHKEKWINTIVNSGGKPVLEIIWQGDISQLDEKETQYIALFKALGAKLTNATQGGLTTRGRKCSEETKEKFRKMFTGKCLRPPITEEEKRQASIRRKGVWKNSPEAIEKIRIAKKGVPTNRILSPEALSKWHSAALAKSIKIIAVNNGTETTYPSINEAVRCTGVDRTSIKRFLIGKRKSCKGYLFKYA